MTKDEVFFEVQEIFRDIFDEEELVINGETNSENIEEWDSLNHISLISAIEKQFKIKFSLDEFQEIKDVGAMINIIESKLKA